MKRYHSWLSICVLVFTALTVLFLVNEKEASTEIHPKVEKKKPYTETPSPFTMLVMGVDERARDTGRSDVLMVASVNSATNEARLLQIPRDTRVEMIGKGTYEKINHAYAYGGIDMTIQTVEKFLNIPIHYYMKVDMNGFQQVIDVLGGIEVDNEFAFTFNHHEFKEGKMTLNGEQALSYVRMRKEDPEGDLGRNKRQRKVIKAMMEKAWSADLVTHLPQLMNVAKEKVDTNIGLTDMLTMYQAFKKGVPSIEPIVVKGETQMMDGTWYYLIDSKEKEHVSTMLQYEAELPTEH
ncbi:LCP family protein [Metabacillus iocasae]|uniref:LCP family protein required for cell wall assembly n=1 Tax=Priestia iocasae TaxID=2291674 RepID=A0ABS2QWS1_9BACI|nr:LCP family protein [Metabacillus iocasae]MBM7703935.1 LCP family protein required for cell wall assembly [Metabacillus iocasae]